MTIVDYPWRWLTEGVGTSFVVRYPWVEAVRRAAVQSESVCVLLPETIGAVPSWCAWLTEQIDRNASSACLTGAGDFPSVTRAIAESYQIGNGFTSGRPADWARVFLAECRRQMPHCDPVPVLVVDADDDCAEGLHHLIQAQRALGYQFARPVLVRHTPPPGWAGEIVRFGPPELGGDLHRISPPPERDLAFWTNLLLVLTIVWEAGATPNLADELWDQLRVGRTMSLRDHGFDDWLKRQLDEFTTRNIRPLEEPLPTALAFGPLREVEDMLWQRGIVAWQDGHFDITPIRARLWVRALNDTDAQESLRRRRLANVPLTRWLSAWATSIEESLRVAALQIGSAKFRRFLETQPPRNRRGAGFRSRLEELGPTDDSIGAIDSADFGDLAAFVAHSRPREGRHLNLANFLDLCRIARNRVVHERKLSAGDLLQIARAVSWLSEDGLI